MAIALPKLYFPETSLPDESVKGKRSPIVAWIVLEAEDAKLPSLYVTPTSNALNSGGDNWIGKWVTDQPPV